MTQMHIRLNLFYKKACVKQLLKYISIIVRVLPEVFGFHESGVVFAFFTAGMTRTEINLLDL